jgi:hypothetical protein
MGGSGLPQRADAISRPDNSGHQLIQLAVRFGGLHLPLIGFDMQRTDGKTHCHEDHQAPLVNGDPATWLPHFPPLAADLKAAGVDVVNCTIQSALTCFRRGDLAEELR